MIKPPFSSKNVNNPSRVIQSHIVVNTIYDGSLVRLYQTATKDECITEWDKPEETKKNKPQHSQLSGYEKISICLGFLFLIATIVVPVIIFLLSK